MKTVETQKRHWQTPDKIYIWFTKDPGKNGILAIQNRQTWKQMKEGLCLQAEEKEQSMHVIC